MHSNGYSVTVKPNQTTLNSRCQAFIKCNVISFTKKHSIKFSTIKMDYKQLPVQYQIFAVWDILFRMFTFHIFQVCIPSCIENPFLKDPLQVSPARILSISPIKAASPHISKHQPQIRLYQPQINSTTNRHKFILPFPTRWRNCFFSLDQMITIRLLLRYPMLRLKLHKVRKKTDS